MRIPVKNVYLDCTSPAFPAGFIEEAEWDTEQGALYVQLEASQVAVPFVRCRQVTTRDITFHKGTKVSPVLEEPLAVPAPEVKPEPKRRRFVK